VSAALIQNRLVMSTSSGFFSSSTLTVLGSSAIPQMGQSPGASLTISGCMGQVYSVFVAGIAATVGSRAIPHFGQSPGPCWRTSGSIGHVYSFAAFGATTGAWAAAIDASCLGCVETTTTGPELEGVGMIWTGRADMGAMPISVFGARYFAGSALNFCWQPWQQK
jgi:hypothetical protein